jgi:hypothetical protein
MILHAGTNKEEHHVNKTLQFGSGLLGPIIATNITTKLGKNVTRGGVHGTEDKPSS